MSLLLMCALGMAGCEERSLDDLKAEVAAREAVAAAQAAREEAKSKGTYVIKPYRYSYELVKVCIDGVEYYYGDNGHSGMLAPVVRDNSVNIVFSRCDKPTEQK